MKSLLEMFPRASASTVAANPHLSASATSTQKTNKNDVQVNVPRKRGSYATSMSGEPYWSEGKPKWNKTEAEYALILEAMKRKGEILRYEFEGITLRWADMKYTPDFVVFVERARIGNRNMEWAKIKLIEVKGGHIWDRDIVRFKGARAYWPEFAFEMHQKTKNGWVRKF